MTDARVELLLKQQIHDVAGGNRLCLHGGNKPETGHVRMIKNATIIALTAQMHSHRKGHHRA